MKKEKLTKVVTFRMTDRVFKQAKKFKINISEVARDAIDKYVYLFQKNEK